jgi:signal transduction histidine kinase
MLICLENRMRRFVLGLALLLYFQTGQSQVKLDGRDSYSLNGFVSIYKEKDSLDFNQAIRLYLNGEFQKVATPVNEFNDGVAEKIYWIAFTVRNVMDTTLEIETGIANAGVFTLECYIGTTTMQLINHWVTGSYNNFNTRVIKSRHFYFPLPTAAHSEKVVLFRVDMRGTGLYTPLRLVSKSHRQDVEQGSYVFYAFFSGFLTFVSLFSAITFFLTREKIYLYYSLYVVFCCWMFLADGSMDSVWLYPNWPALASIANLMSGLGINFCMLLFINDFLQLKKSRPLLSKIARSWCFMIVCLAILVVLEYIILKTYTLRPFIYVYGAVCVIGAWSIQIFGIVRRCLDGFRAAYLYGLAMLSAVISTTIYFLHAFDFITFLYPGFNLILSGFGIEIVILAFALMYTYHLYKTTSQNLSLKVIQQQLDFSNQLVKTQENEQKRIAQDLHDELGGNLAALKLNLQNIVIAEPHSSKIISLIDKASNSARSIAHNLMPPEFTETSLHDMLKAYFNRLNAESKIQFHFIHIGNNNAFTKQEELMVYRLLLEISNNIIKHSGATEATVQLIYYDDYLGILAEDNGKGFDNNATPGLGLKNMNSRVNFMNGNIKVDSGEKGTTIVINIPFNSADE